MTALLTAYLGAVSIGAPARLQSPVSPPFVVVLNAGDTVYDAGSTTPVYTATSNFDTRQVLATQFVKTAAPTTTPSTMPVVDPTMVVFGDGHALVLEPNTKIQMLSPCVVGTKLNGTAVYLSYGQATVTNVSASFLTGGFHGGPSQIIVKTKATTTGAKGTTVSVSATIDALGNNTTTTVNYDSTECLLFQGDSPTSSSPSVTLPVGSQSKVTYPNAVGLPTPIPYPVVPPGPGPG